MVVAASALVVVGLLGLSVDLGRMYVVKNELQNFTDAASIAAAHKLNGTNDGITAARVRALADTNRWNFGNDSVSDITVTFATDSTGNFSETPAIGSAYRFVRVDATAASELMFMGIFPGIGRAQNVNARSIAGQAAVAGMGDGVLPFSPDAHDPNDVTGNFGFLRGRNYTLRWDNLTGNTNGLPANSYIESSDGVDLVGCDADMDGTTAGFQPGETSNSQRGYIDLADLEPIDGGGGAALIRYIVEGKASFEQSIVPYQYWVTPEPGEKQTVLGSMDDRVASDTDRSTATHYTTAQTAPETPSSESMNTSFRSSYEVAEPRPPAGNGRRLVTVPVNDPLSNGVVIGFAGFFLPPEPCAEVKIDNHKYYPCCGEYVGSTLLNGGGSGANPGGGTFRISLFE